MSVQRILIIDDEEAIRFALRDVLEYENYTVVDAEDAAKALFILENEKFDVIICDIKMPGMDGIELLSKIQLISDTPVIMITGHGDIDTAVDAIKKGAYDFITKPPDLNRLLVSVRNAKDKQHLVRETKKLKKIVDKKYDIIGESQAIVQLKQTIEKVAPTNARVLITGENGTGKELVAHWLHEKSERSSHTFVEVNCAAIPTELIESELFGHEKGSFTSAIKQRKGNFELADNGTLFLDEIGDMSLSAQAKVLRALQEHKITRVGGEKDIQVNVRVITATNKDLAAEIKNRTFREDLYHRLNVINLHVPPLRERTEDIPLLVDHFINQICDSQGHSPRSFTDDAIIELQKLTWKGNIRELYNMVERLIILCDNPISGEDVIKHTTHL